MAKSTSTGLTLTDRARPDAWLWLWDHVGRYGAQCRDYGRTLSGLALAELGVGVLLVAIALYDLFQSVVVPRPASSRTRPSTLFVRSSWRVWRGLGAGRSNVLKREAFLGSYAPFAVLMLLALWVLFLIIGFGLMLHALSWQMRPALPDLGTSMYFSGLSLITLGFGDIVPLGLASRIIVLIEAATGLGVVALVISLLFSLYGSFQRREALVVTLDASAGVPPSGVTLLETAQKLAYPELLPQTFEAWKLWSAEVLDSHLAYPILSYFRSSHDYESWISALGAVLDASTLVLTTLEDVPRGPAKLMYEVGGHLVEDLIHYFRFSDSHVPGVEQSEFEDARARLSRCGYRVREAEAAWADFSKLRGNYAGRLNNLAAFLAIPPAQWIGDRSLLAVRRHPGRVRQVVE